MKKHYSYSVKDELIKYFPGDTITEMRISKSDSVQSEREGIIPRAWAYADNMALGYFLKGSFLVDTVLYDDYIAYFLKSNHGNEVMLSFMHFENEPPFSLDPEYAYEIAQGWEQKGYKAYIMRNCVGIDNYPNSDNFRFISHSCEDKGTDFLIPTLVNGKYIFVRESEPFWKHADALLLSAIKSGDVTKYESILADDAVITRCPYRSEYDRANNKYENTETFAEGILNIKDYYDCKNNVFTAYVKKRKSAAYTTYLVADNNKYILFIGAKNQIVKLVEEPIMGDEEFVPIPSELMPKVITMPELIGVRALEISTMHAYGIQLTYDDGCIKNYYLSSFIRENIPETVMVEEYEFNKEILESVKLICDSECKGVIFSNGYYIPNHILYYRGITQFIPEKISDMTFENKNVKLEGLYREPFHIRRSGLFETYQPRSDEFYGTGYTLLDENGNRTTDYSGSYIDGRGTKDRDILCTTSESSNLVGYLKKDGSWLIPPIFDKGGDFEYSHCVEVEKGNKKYLFNELGELIDFPYDISLRNFSQDLCEFSTGRYEGKYGFPDEEYFEELSAGNWGFVDKHGKIVIEPQYVFTSGFGYSENRAFVAKAIDGKILWGLIDEKGNEIIPCVYNELSTHSGTAVNFRKTEHGKFGIMNFDGNVIMEPRYSGIYEYDQKHGLIAYFTDWDKGHQVGVARVGSGEVIIPNKYCYVGFEDNYIECEMDFHDEDGNLYDYYDYDGNKLPSEKCINGWSCDGGYGKWNSDHKCGAVDKDNNIIVPFVFDESSHVDYYLRGFVVTGKKGNYGVTTRDGKTILPEKYRGITIKNDFIIASCENDNSWNLIDELYTLDGTPLFSDIYRRVYINGDKLTRETPLGIEHYRIIKNKMSC